MDLTLLLRVLSMRRVLRGREHWTASQIAAHQSKEVSFLRAYAHDHSPFYRRFHAGFESKPLDQLPVLTKSELMDNFDDLVTDRTVRLTHVRDHLERLKGDELFLGKYRITRTA